MKSPLLWTKISLQKFRCKEKQTKEKQTKEKHSAWLREYLEELAPFRTPQRDADIIRYKHLATLNKRSDLGDKILVKKLQIVMQSFLIIENS